MLPIPVRQGEQDIAIDATDAITLRALPCDPRSAWLLSTGLVGRGCPLRRVVETNYYRAIYDRERSASPAPSGRGQGARVDCGLFLSGKPRAFRAGSFTGTGQR